MLLTQRVKVKATKEQELVLDGQSRICNWTYNQFLEARINGYKWFKKSYGYYDCNAYLPEFKDDHPFLKTVYSQVLKETLRVLDKAYANFFRRIREGAEKPGFPHFKSWKRKWFPLIYPRGKGYKLLDDSTMEITLGKNEQGNQLRQVLSLDQPITYPMESCHGLVVTKVKYNYYLSAIFEVPPPEKAEIKTAIGIDPNQKNVFVGVDTNGKAIKMEGKGAAPYFDKQIDKLKGRRDKCRKYSRKWERYTGALDRLYSKRRDQTKLMCYTVANALVGDYDMIAYGDYSPDAADIKKKNGDPAKKANKRINHSCLAQGIVGQLRQTVEWVCEKNGKTFEKVNEYRTTRTCSNCGYVFPDGLDTSVRVFNCPKCHSQIDRDANSGINILRRTRHETPGVLCAASWQWSPFSGLQVNPSTMVYNIL